MSIDVLVTYGWVRSSYAALRNLSLHNLSVAACDAYPFGMCQSSKFIKGFYRYHNPFIYGEDRFITDMIAIVEKTHPLLILPSHDETEVLARYRDLFPEGSLSLLAPSIKIIQANDKAKMAAFAQAQGIPLPHTYEFDDVSRLSSMLSVSGDYVVKLRQGNSAKGVFYANGRDATVALVRKTITEYNLSVNRYPVVQDRVRGDGWGVSCLYWEGEKIASYTHRRLREKTTTGGTSTLREGDTNQEMEEAAFLLLNKMKWHGLIMVEFKHNAENGDYWFIETNPRMWGSICLAIESGVEFPYLTYLCARKGPDAARQYFAGRRKRHIRARWYLGDIILAASLLKERRELSSALRLCMPGGADYYDDIFLDDPLVFIGEARNYLNRFLRTKSLNPVDGGAIG